jgi:hypothetical protein
MATRSQQFKADAQRTGSAPPRDAAEAQPQEPHGHAEKKATVAREAQAESGQPSRKSTRKSANHAKTDTGVVRAQQMKQSTPEARFARTDAHRKDDRLAGSR